MIRTGALPDREVVAGRDRTTWVGATVARFELEGGGAEVTVRSYSGSIEAVAD